MSSVQYLNPRAEVLRKVQALAMNINASRSLQNIMKTNLGPKGTLKMLVGGAGQVKITKDGSVLLHEMQIQHPTASMIARSATAQDDTVGDGTTSNVLLVGELLYQAEKLIQEGLHPRVITEGYELARTHILKFLNTFKQDKEVDTALLRSVAKTSLCSKVHPDLANLLIDAVVESVLLIRQNDLPADLFMIEIMHMQNKLGTDTRFIRGLVLDHGTRHPDMPKRLERVYILNANVSLEYEKTEVNSGFYFATADQREKLADSERRFTDERCRKIIELKKKVCDGTDKGFILLNQKGIDPICLDMLAKENIMALRRTKRRNGERISLAFGGQCVNSVDDLSVNDLGFAETVYEQTLGDDKYTFVEGAKDPKSCTILIRGPNDHTIAMIKEAVRDGLRAVKNTIEDKSVVPGAGAFEIAAYTELMSYKDEVSGKAKLGVQAFAESMLCIPKVLAENAGFDVQDTILSLVDAYKKNKVPTGLNVEDGKPISPEMNGIYDNYSVKRSILNIAPVLAQQLLLVDEVIKAGKRMGAQADQDGA
eukprot:TRINITY_DN8057_c0_g1_i1.p1 TRINITY_DN8057_c0_g1~~TRINITY_DN8057_c0_g1_i1.p1  ORF type:complete len:538 (+),score=138.08 TRINITY_DN8057_c0_g1_i1:155-1768(+)